MSVIMVCYICFILVMYFIGVKNEIKVSKVVKELLVIVEIGKHNQNQKHEKEKRKSTYG